MSLLNTLFNTSFGQQTNQDVIHTDSYGNQYTIDAFGNHRAIPKPAANNNYNQYGYSQMNMSQAQYNQQLQNQMAQNAYNVQASSMAANGALSQQAYYWQINDDLNSIIKLRKAKEKELLESNAGLLAAKEEVIKAEEQYRLLLALAMPCDDDLLREHKK